MRTLNRLLSKSFYIYNRKEVQRRIRHDEAANAYFRNGGNVLSRKEKRSIEFRTVVLYRKFQCNYGNLFGYYYRYLLERNALKTGIDFLNNPNIGEGLVIGHWGKILINGNAQLGNNIMITHGVTIGRDIRGKRAGAPTIGNSVCIRTNSTVVGNIVIGDDVLIAPNTFVNFDVPSHSIVIGNPATIHHKLNATEGHVGIFKDE